MIRMVSVPGLCFSMAVADGVNLQRGLDKMKKLSRLERYHLNKVSQRNPGKVVAVTPEAMEIENRAIERERRGHYRIAVRRDQCITKSNGLRCGDYSGILSRGVIYD